MPIATTVAAIAMPYQRLLFLLLSSGFTCLGPGPTVVTSAWHGMERMDVLIRRSDRIFFIILWGLEVVSHPWILRDRQLNSESKKRVRIVFEARETLFSMPRR